LVEVDAATAASDDHYPKIARRLAEAKAKTEPNGAIWANQFDNIANRQGHLETTGPEIWRDTNGTVDGFICAVGSGGTLGGVSMSLKARNKDVVIGIADPGGAALYEWYKNGQLKAEGTSITEGIGQGRVTANLEDVVVDEAFRIEDKDWLPVLYRLVQEEGLCLGGSSALNVLGAMQLARKLGPGKTIVTVLCDYGNRYMSRLFNPEFLRSKDLPTPPWLT
jgi:cysteine synthase A